MANKKVTDLTALTSADATDVLPIVDVSANTTKKVTTAGLVGGFTDALTGAHINWTATGADSGIWWEELGRTTLTSSGDTMTVSSIPARKYLHLIVNIQTSSALSVSMRFNNDSSANYSTRFVLNASSVSGTAVSNTSINNFAGSTSTSTPLIIVGDIMNVATIAKLGRFSSVSGSTSAATAPDMLELYGKWANGTDQISRIDILNTAAGDFASGSELIILGHN